MLSWLLEYEAKLNFKNRKLLYLVDKVGYDVNERSWEPTDNLAHAQSPIEDFHARFPLKPRYPISVS